MVSRLLVLVLLLLPLGCRSPGAHSDPPCTCGQAQSDIEGCSHPQCLAGKRNPDNPDCNCGPLTIKKN